MDLEYFLKDRTSFIKYFYSHASNPFSEIKKLIENKEEPFVPPYSEDPEPAFLSEWQEADAGLETVGHACLSLLSSSLHLFLKAWVHRLEQQHGIKTTANFRKNGWFHGYKSIFLLLELPLEKCPADLSLIEQITLARNRVQHPEEITALHVNHSSADLERFPNPFFAKERELEIASNIEGTNIDWWIKPSIATTQEKIYEAIEQVEKLCSWLEAEYWRAQDT